MTANEAKVIVEDLDFIETEWRGSLSDAAIRRSSAVLRHLLVDQNLHRAAGAFKMKLRILVPEASFLEHVPFIDSTAFYWPGGTAYDIGHTKSFMTLRRALAAPEVKLLYDTLNAVEDSLRPLPIDQFLRHLSFCIGGVVATKRDVIKYVCNKCGGTHLDERREIPASKADAKDEKVYVLLDDTRKTLKLADRDPVLLEMLCIGQSVVRSKDVQTLRSRLKQLIP